MTTSTTNAIRPRRRSDDLFFVNGDQLALQSSDTIAISYIQEDPNDDDDDDDDGNYPYNLNVDDANSSNDEHENDDENDDRNYNDHYINYLTEATSHPCTECQSIYPNEHLLDLHLQEVHDTYFQLALERKNKGSPYSYTCLVVDCECTFQSEKERYYHLRLTHGYPNWFRFRNRYQRRNQHQRQHQSKQTSRKHHISNEDVNYNEKDNDTVMSKRKTTNWWHNKQINTLSNNNKNNTIIPNDENNTDMSTINQGTNENDNIQTQQRKKKKKKERKEKKKKSNASIPCRFYNTPKGCWRGTNCMFLHSSLTNSQEGEGENEGHDNNDMDICKEIDMLSEQVRTKVKIHIPTNISFGRRRRNY